MSKKKTIYCTNCGKKENSENRKCSNCNQLLYDKDHEIKEYIYDKIKGDIKGKTIEKTSDFIKAFVKKYCYGIVLGISVVFTGAAIVTSNNHNVKYQNQPEKPNVDSQYSYRYLLGCWDTNNRRTRYMFLSNREEFYIGVDGEDEDGNIIYYNWLWMPYYDISKTEDGYSLDLYYKDATDIEPEYSHSTKFKIIDDEHINISVNKGYIQADGSIKMVEEDQMFERKACSTIINEVPSLKEYLEETNN